MDTQTMQRRSPAPTVDMLVFDPARGLALVKRRYPPPGWALPGGFVEYGETVENAAVRETLEETGLHVRLDKLFGVYSDPARDARQHTISTVFVCSAHNPGDINGGDDAAEARFFPLDALPHPIAFDHEAIIMDFKIWLAAQERH